MNISFNSSHGNQGEVVLLGAEHGPKPEHLLPLQAELDLAFVPVEMSPRPPGPLLCVPPLQAGGGTEQGKCNMQETTSALLFLPGRARSPCVMFCRDGGTSSSGLTILEEVIPEVKRHESRQN